MLNLFILFFKVVSYLHKKLTNDTNTVNFIQLISVSFMLKKMAIDLRTKKDTNSQ